MTQVLYITQPVHVGFQAHACDAGNPGSIPSRNILVSGAVIDDGDDLSKISPQYCTVQYTSRTCRYSSTINISHCLAGSRERHFIPVTSLRAASCSSGTFSTKNGAIPVIENNIIIFEDRSRYVAKTSFPDPDTAVFGPHGSGSIIICTVPDPDAAPEQSRSSTRKKFLKNLVTCYL